MVEVMKIMATSFKRSCARTATLSTPDPAAGHCRPMPLPETPGHSQASLGQFLVESLLLSPGSWCIQGSVCALQESVSQSCVSSGGSVMALMATSSKRAYAITQVCCTQRPCPCSSPLLTHTLQETLKHSSGSVSVGSLGPGTHKICLSPLSMSGGKGLILNAFSPLLPSF